MSELNIELMSRDALEVDIESCLDIIASTKDIFSLPDNLLYCESAVGVKTLAIVVKSLDTSTAVFDCVTPTYNLISSSIGNRCGK